MQVVSIRYPLLVVSKNFFNESGQVIACPILPDGVRGPLRIWCESIRKPGFVYCEQLRLLDLNSRQFARKDAVSMDELMDVADAIQSMFDYI